MVDNGFYQVGNEIFYSKIEAILASQSSGHWPHWNFHDYEYNNINWTIEPEFSLQQLYSQRAQQLREKYNYIVLHYSGGSDSNQVLQSFIDAGVAIDEISIRTLNNGLAVDLNDLRPQNTYGGHPIAYKNALSVKNQHWPLLKITELNVNSALETVLDRSSSLEFSSGSLSLANSWKNFYLYHNSRHLSDQGLKVCHLLGMDKPRLYLDEQGWHTKFLDKMISHQCTKDSFINEDFNVELFYWSGDSALMLAKQCHVLLHAFKKGLISAQSLSGSDRYSQLERAKFIYNYTFNTWADNKVSATGVINEIEQWFYQSNDHRAYCRWQSKINLLQHDLSSQWLHSQNLLDGLVGSWSKKYYLKGKV